jgi:hypothetical protein
MFNGNLVVLLLAIAALAGIANGNDKVFCAGPVTIVVGIDQTKSTRSNGLAPIRISQVGPLVTLIRTCGGDLYLTPIGSRPLSNETVHLNLLVPPVAPVCPNLQELSVLKRAEVARKCRLQEELYQQRRLKWQRDADQAESDFRTKAAKLLSLQGSYRSTDLVSFFEYAKTISEEGLAERSRVFVVVVSDMKHNADTKSPPEFPQKCRLVLVVPTGRKGILSSHTSAQVFAGVDAAITHITNASVR